MSDQTETVRLAARRDWLLTATRTVREEVLREYKVNSRIASTRALIGTLAYFGVHAHPEPVTVALFNLDPPRK